MATIKIELPDELVVKGGGAVLKITDIESWDASALAYVFRYGLGRAHQDHTNSAAKIARDAGEDFDAEAVLAKRAESFRTGTFGSRTGGGKDPVEAEMIRIARAKAKEAEAEAYEAAKDQAGRDAVVEAWLSKLGKEKLALVRDAAEESLRQKVEEAARRAKLAASLVDL